MELDLETFLTTLYVRVDDLYQQTVRPQMEEALGSLTRRHLAVETTQFKTKEPNRQQ